MKAEEAVEERNGLIEKDGDGDLIFSFSLFTLMNWIEFTKKELQFDKDEELSEKIARFGTSITNMLPPKSIIQPLA